MGEAVLARGLAERGARDWQQQRRLPFLPPTWEAEKRLTEVNDWPLMWPFALGGIFRRPAVVAVAAGSLSG